MSLHETFQRLAIKSSSICSSCRRALTTSARRQQASNSAMDALLAASSAHTRSRSPPAATQHDLASAAVAEHAAASRRHLARASSIASLAASAVRKDLEVQLPRRWRAGDVYAPHDLTGVEMSKWKKARKRSKGGRDVVDLLHLKPMEHYKNFAMMSEYMTEMGRIRHSIDTGLRPVNQRRMAKAVRRAIGLGLMPSVHRHPEILKMERETGRARRY